MSKNKAELQAELDALGKQLGVPVILDQTNDLLEAEIATLTDRLAAQNGSETGETGETGEPGDITIVALTTFESRFDNKKYKLSKARTDTLPALFAAALIEAGVARAVIDGDAE